MFGLEIFDAGLLVAMFIALFGGVISFLSPCVLPIIPPYLAYMGGITVNDLTDGPASRRPAVIASLFFVMGLSTVFLLLGFTASVFGRFFLQNQVLFGQIAGAVIIVFGLHFMGLFKIKLFMREARLDAGDRGGSAVGAYVLGLAFAFGWTPCIGPILGAILSMSAQEDSIGRGTLLMGMYATGLGVPFILSAVFMNRAMGVMNRLKKHMGLIEKVMGLLLIVVGIMMLTGAFTQMSYWLLEKLPFLAQIG
jgi:cytochrome c-type biogenesis protein